MRRERASGSSVTCVVTAYNYGRFIGRCLDSVLGQDHPRDRLEVVVVDDGSTDDTRAVVASYGDAVRYLRQDNAGQIAATNRGIAAATGGYLLLVDADDTIPPDRVSTQAAILDAREEVGLVYGDMTIIDADDRQLRASYHGTEPVTPHAGRVLGPLLVENFMPGGTMMFRARDRHVYHPIPPQASVQDWWIGTRLAAVSEVAYVDRPMNHYRLHGANDNLGASEERKLRLIANDLRFRRWVLGQMDLSGVELPHVLRALVTYDRFLKHVSGGLGEPLEALAPVSGDEARRSALELARARMARDRGDDEAAARSLVLAVAADPCSLAAREELAALLPGGAGAPPRLDARSFVTLALADELLADRRLLGAYAAAFGDGDDATLLIYGPAADPSVADRLGALVADAGLDGDGSPDMVAVFGPGDPGDHPGVARGVHAALTGRASLVPPGVPRWGAEGVAELRSYADRLLAAA
ncbi:MAG TPA: glycosyltransferase [Baekduia sp.]|nr:glycosyltransferase [Baekduia sp.]